MPGEFAEFPTRDELAHYKAVFVHLYELPASHPIHRVYQPLREAGGVAQGPALEDQLVWPEELFAHYHRALETHTDPDGTPAMDSFVERWTRLLANLQALEARWPGLIPPRARPARTALQVLSPVTVMAADRARSTPVLATSLRGEPSLVSGVPWWAWALSATGALLAGYHGYRRQGRKVNGWTALWVVSGVVLPIPAVAVAFFQGYGKKG